MISFPLIGYVLTAAVRDRLIISLMVLVAVGASLAIFLGSSAVTERDQFSLVFAAGGLRVAGVVGLVLFTVFYVRRAFESRDVDYLLSRPISRISFILSHAAAFSLIAALMAVVVCASVFLTAPHTVDSGHILWAASITAEFVIMVNAALFFAMVLPSASAGALAVFALYLLARLMGQILGIVDSGLNVGYLQYLSMIMQTISLIVPRLDLMGQTSWLVYEDHNIGMLFIVAQGIIYSALLITAAMVDLVLRQF